MFFENRFTLSAEKVLRCAHKCAAELGHGYVGSEHLLLALSRQTEGKSKEALIKAGGTEEKISKVICERVGKGRKNSGTPQGLTPAVKRAVTMAYTTAEREGKTFIGEEHLLRGLLCESESEATRLLSILGSLFQ